jgi:hypothetical protein
LLSALKDKPLEVSITAAAKAQAAAQFHSDKPKPDTTIPLKPDRADKLKPRPKERSNGRPQPNQPRTQKKSETTPDK